MHSSPLYDVIEQTRAAEEIAPPGFRLHWDFNHTRTPGVVLPVVEELRHHPMVGFIEDPLPWDDLVGWRSLRQQNPHYDDPHPGRRRQRRLPCHARTPATGRLVHRATARAGLSNRTESVHIIDTRA